MLHFVNWLIGIPCLGTSSLNIHQALLVFVDVLPLQEIYPCSSVPRAKSRYWKTIPWSSILNIMLPVCVNSETETHLEHIQTWDKTWEMHAWMLDNYPGKEKTPISWNLLRLSGLRVKAQVKHEDEAWIFCSRFDGQHWSIWQTVPWSDSVHKQRHLPGFISI